ncbi:calcium-activated chloride channel regulator 1-like isoform X2 [Panulirus ornatus]|uniref:calcium-activated chloride channel regulator 1-like isoform X2 n=1 Tax=Panulirus ornatus TaxID=150431 RepID=UPI003A8887F7
MVMMWWWWCCTSVALAYFLVGVNGRMTSVEDDDPYSNLVVKVGLELEDCNIVLTNTMEILQKASEALQNASHGLLAFSGVTVVVPKLLATSCGLPTEVPEVVKMPEAHLILANDHPVFGDQPWTLQSQGCGRAGDLLYMPYTFLRNSSSSFALRGNRVIHEWAKFRWGVFEEYGLKGDPVFPPAYSRIAAYPSTTGGWLPNFCANADLNGRFKEPCHPPDCSFELEREQSATSSLLALPNLVSVTDFCDADSHQFLTPTKQNAQCRGRSVMEILKNHLDFQRSPVIPGDPTWSGDAFDMTYVTYNPEAAGTYVLLMEATSFMSNNKCIERWDLLRATVKQWVMEDILTNSNLGIVTFTSTPSLRQPLTTVSTVSRPTLADALPFSPSSSSSQNVVNALNYVKNYLLLQGGTIILLVNPASLSSSAEAMVTAAGPCAVWPILFPFTSSVNQVNINSFRTLASRTGGQVLKVNDETYSFDSTRRQSLRVQQDLTQHLRRIQVETLKQTSLIPKIQEPAYVVANNDVPLITYSVTDKVFTVSPRNLKVGNNNIYVGFTVKLEPHLVDVVATKADDGLQVELWSSHDFSFLHLDKPDDPVSLYVRVSKSERPVVGAEVTVGIQGEVSTFDLRLKDNGGGSPDVTGGDGVYSRYWVFAPGNVDACTLMIKVRGTSSSEVVGYTTSTPNTGVVCCGSSIRGDHLPREIFTSNIQYLATQAVVLSEAGQLDVFPPARVTDLYCVPYDGKVILSFTAPGDDLDYGYALEYWVLWAHQSREWKVVQNTTYSVVEGGSVAVVEFAPPICDRQLYYLVRARDTLLQESADSNVAAVTVSCDVVPSHPPPTEPPDFPCSRVGAIWGAFFGGLAAGLIIVASGYFFYFKYYKRSTTPKPRSPQFGHTNVTFSPGSPPDSSSAHSLADIKIIRKVDEPRTTTPVAITAFNRVRSERQLPVPPPSSDATPEDYYENSADDDEFTFEGEYEEPNVTDESLQKSEALYINA